MESIPVAVARDHARGHVHDGDRHQAHDSGRRRGYRVEPRHVDGRARHGTAGPCGSTDAKVVREGIGGYRKMTRTQTKEAARFDKLSANDSLRRSADLFAVR